MTRQFKFSGWFAPDVVQTLDGQVWVSIVPPKAGLWNTWIEVERIQSAEGFSYPRNPHNYPFAGFGARSGRSTGDPFRRPSPEPESKYGIRDHHPMSDKEREQALLYAQMYTPDPEMIRKLLGEMQ